MTSIETIKSAALELGYLVTSNRPDATAANECRAIVALTQPNAVYRRRAHGRPLSNVELLAGPKNTPIGIEPRYELFVITSLRTNRSRFVLRYDGAVIAKQDFAHDASGRGAQRHGVARAFVEASARAQLLGREDIRLREFKAGFDTARRRRLVRLLRRS